MGIFKNGLLCCCAGLLSWGHILGEDVPDFKEGKGGELTELALPKPEEFKSEDGRRVWKIKIPGDRPLATPAIADGILYVGGGFGSHEFYALNAKTGERVWSFKTGDDGPTAAVVAEGCVAYNTESCTLYVHDAKSGKVLWERWLGDPLMSQPAIADSRLFMAYPSAGGHHLVAFELKTGKVIWDKKIAAEIITAPVIDSSVLVAATADGTLYQFDAASGKELWSKQCNATSAPRIVGDKIYFSQRGVKEIEITAGTGADAKKVKSQATVEGFNVLATATGKLVYDEPQAAVQATYLLTAQSCEKSFAENAQTAIAGYVSARSSAAAMSDHFETIVSGPLSIELRDYSKSKAPENAMDGIADTKKALELADKLDAAAKPPEGAVVDKEKEELRRIAGQLRQTAEQTKVAAEAAQQAQKNTLALQSEQLEAHAQDSTVGFGGGAPDIANAPAASGNIGKNNVKAIWAYQGSRPCIYDGRMFCVNGDTFRAMDAGKFSQEWDSKVDSKVAASRPASTPALAGGKFYLATSDGRILCVSSKDGKTMWETKVGGVITFEPAVAGGYIYAASNDGTLIALEAGDALADGWSMWGGSARHNGGTK
jgi:outer membrane protein assembly factor BamB